MQIKYLKPFLFFIPAVILQLVAVPLISVEGTTPDFVTIVLIYFVLNSGQFYGTVLGFVFGLLFDLISGGVLGSAMFSKTLAGFLTGYFYNENKIELNTNTYLFVLIVFVISTVDSILYTSLSATATKSLVTVLLFSGLLPGLYSAIVSFPLVIFKRKNVIE